AATGDRNGAGGGRGAGDQQRTAVDRGGAGVIVGAAQGQRAAAGLGQGRPGPQDWRGDGRGAGVVDGQIGQPAQAADGAVELHLRGGIGGRDGQRAGAAAVAVDGAG